MKLLLFLIIPALVSSQTYTTYDDSRYTRTAVLTIRGLPTNLVYNPINKDLHFTLIDLESLQNDHVQTKMDQYILRDHFPIKIDNVRGQAAAVDVKNEKVYIASDDGLYTLNSTDKAEFLSLKDEDIVQLFKPNHKDELYAILYPENEVYLIDVEKNEKKKLEQVPCAFILAVDHQDNIFYECDSKYVKMILKGFYEPIEFVGIHKNSARAIGIDQNRTVLAANDGLYLLRPDNVIPVKLMDLDFIPSGITFDEDSNFYLSTNGVIYKYTAIGENNVEEK